jgi:cytochrome c-type protein NapB
MKFLNPVSASIVVLILSSPTVLATSQNQSLRGSLPIDGGSEKAIIMRWQDDKEPIKRDYVRQPPLIPHSVESYKINLKFNKCLTCHSWANYKDAKATKISQTHFEGREGNELANVSARRYFCTQCHVPQVDAKPLVKNNFEPVQGISGRKTQ